MGLKLIAQLVEHCTGIRVVMQGLSPVEGLPFATAQVALHNREDH